MRNQHRERLRALETADHLKLLSMEGAVQHDLDDWGRVDCWSQHGEPASRCEDKHWSAARRQHYLEATS